jgi:hypothetical protein
MGSYQRLPFAPSRWGYFYSYRPPVRDAIRKIL